MHLIQFRLKQILGKEVNREELLQHIIEAFERNYELIRSANYGTIAAMYHDALYRSKGFLYLRRCKRSV